MQLQKVKKFLSNKILYVGLGLITLISAAFYLLLMREAKTDAVESVLRQEQTIARAETNNITSFFGTFGDSLSALAKSSSIKLRNASTLEDMDSFVNQWKGSGMVNGVGLIDARGVVEFNSNTAGTRDSGMSVADRSYYTWAKNEAKEGEYFIGEPVVARGGSNKGQVVVPVASAIFENGVFSGVLASSVQLKPLTDHYLGLMRVSDKTEVYLINTDGTFLYNSAFPESNGVNAFDDVQNQLFANNKDLVNLLKSKQPEDGEGSFEGRYQGTKSKMMEDHLVAYSPIHLGSQNWMLVMSSPIEQVNDITRPIYIRQLSVFILIILCIISFRIIVVVENKNQNRL